MSSFKATGGWAANGCSRGGAGTDFASSVSTGTNTSAETAGEGLPCCQRIRSPRAAATITANPRYGHREEVAFEALVSVSWCRRSAAVTGVGEGGMAFAGFFGLIGVGVGIRFSNSLIEEIIGASLGTRSDG